MMQSVLITKQLDLPNSNADTDLKMVGKMYPIVPEGFSREIQSSSNIYNKKGMGTESELFSGRKI